jgi:serine/threonine-protein kinase
MSLIAELLHRRVVRALVAYGLAAFGLLQIIEPIMHGLHWPEAVLSYCVVALGLGFPVVVCLAWIFDVKAGRLERVVAAAPSSSGNRARLLMPIGIGLLAAAPGLVYYLAMRGPRPSTAGTASTAPGPSIAVLPLVNLSSDKEQEYFSDGLSEELLNLLARVPGLRVAARTSAFAFKGKNEDVAAIGEKLHVATILEGSVRKAGDRIRITAQLVNAADGYHLWSETYDRKLVDVFMVQDEIAQAVVDALKLKLLQAPAAKGRRSPNPEAYTQYLLGQQLHHRNSLDGFRRSQQAFEKAVALEPGYAPAWAGLARAVYWVGDSADSSAAVAESHHRALAAAGRAIELDPELADGYLVRGFLRAIVEWNWDGAREDFARAMALGSDNSDAQLLYAISLLRPLNRKEEAIAALRKATELDPLNAKAWAALGGMLCDVGQQAAAREALDRSLAISPDQAYPPAILAVSFLLDGNPAQALESARRSSDTIWRLTGEALAEHALGHAREAQAALDELISGVGHSAGYQIGEIYAFRGDRDRAFEWLERARKVRDGGLTLVQIDPLLNGLRGDPRYAALLREMNLPAN